MGEQMTGGKKFTFLPPFLHKGAERYMLPGQAVSEEA